MAFVLVKLLFASPPPEPVGEKGFDGSSIGIASAAGMGSPLAAEIS